jgi:hypothetical protein
MVAVMETKTVAAAKIEAGKDIGKIPLVSSETLSEDTTQDPACSAFAVDSHSRLIHTAIEKAVHRPADVVAECRRVLIDQDPVIRPRHRRQTRF